RLATHPTLHGDEERLGGNTIHGALRAHESFTRRLSREIGPDPKRIAPGRRDSRGTQRGGGVGQQRVAGLLQLSHRPAPRGWPPAPEERNTSILRSCGSILMSTSSASGSTATVAAEV